MNLPAFCIRRPAFTIVISLVMIILGMIGFMNLTVRWIPNVNPPEVSISTSYPGASARLVERDVTKVIEDSLSGINGVEMLTSNSRQGDSSISIRFKLGRNMDAAVEDVRTSIDRVRDSLPKDSLNPIVLKADPNTDALMYISFNDQQRSERELGDYISKFVVPSLETVDGVGTVWVYGKRVSAMRVWLDPAKMAAANVTVDEVTQLLRDQNASIPSGQIRGHDRYYSIITDTALKTTAEFNDLIIRDNQNQVVRLKDIAEIKIEPEDIDSSFRINGQPGIALGIVPQSTANPLDVEQQIKKVFVDLQRTLPAGMQAKIIHNQADYIRASIHSVYESFGEAVIFVWLVIFAFLCSFRASVVPAITIPVCLISTFSILYFFGFSINTITLMAFVLAIGLVVDDAIVMLENISRHIEEGMPPFAAALTGSREIIFPIIAMTLTLAAVFTPIAFTSGLLGVLFREFTFTLAGAVIISGIVALTLTPMMCAKILKPNTAHTSRYAKWQANFLTTLQSRYRYILDKLIARRHWVLAVLVLVAALGGGIYHYLKSELAPAEDRNSIYVSVSAPRSASFQYTNHYSQQVESLYKTIPDIESYLSMSFSSAHAFHILMLKPKNQRAHSTADIIAALSAKTSSITGVKINVFPPSPPLSEFAGSDDGDNLGVVLMTTGDYRKLQATTQSIMNALKDNKGFTHVDNSLKWDSEQFQVNVDRNKAADLKVAMSSITNTLSTLLAGRKIGKTEDADVMVQMNQTSLADPNIIQQIYVRNADNKMVGLASLVTTKVATSPEVFRRYSRLRADTIYLSLAPQLKISDAISYLQTIVKANLPEDVKFSFTGEAKSYLESSGKTTLTFLLALVFIYLVLVAQFESFIDPLIILFTVPFAIIGAIVALKLFGGTLNVYSNIGLITLVGLISKHGILITDFANRLRQEGQTPRAAVLEAAAQRLRPILMTTAAMVLGALPLAFAFGPGAESRQQIGLVITGGMLLGTFFSLIVVPIIYTYLAPFNKLSSVTTQEATHAAIL